MSLLSGLRSVARRVLDPQSRLLVRNSSWFLLTQSNAAVCDFLRSVVLARGLGAESFGVFVVVTTLVRTIQEFFNLNLGTGLVKFGAEYKAAQQPDRVVALLKACFALAAITAIASIGFVVAATFLAYDTFIDRPGLRGILQLYAVAASISFFDAVSVSLLNLYFRFQVNSLVKIALDVTELAILATAVWLWPEDLGAVLIAAVMALLVKGLVYNGAALWEMRSVVWPNAATPTRVLVADRPRIAAFLVNNSLSRSVHTLIFSGDVLLLGALAGPAQVGYYTIAKKLAFAILRVTDPMSNSMFPQVARLIAERNVAAVGAMLRRMTGLLAAPMALSVVAVALFGPPVMIWIYGPDFAPAGPAFQILMLGTAIAATFFWSTSVIISLGRVDARLRGYLLALAVGAAIGVWLIPVSGATGLAAAMVAAILVMQFFFVLVCRRELRRQSAA